MAIDSAKLNLHGLPPEVLHQIAGYLHDSHRPSLFAFGLTSKICHDATLRSRFHHIRLEVSSREVLQRDVDALVKSLARTESAYHVRCLGIKGHLQLPVNPKIDGYESRLPDRGTWLKKNGVDEILGDEEPLLGDAEPLVYDESVFPELSEENRAWLSVASLIKTLPHLAKLLYDCQNQFPPILLDALHEYHPQCKLYHLTFRFRTLIAGTPHPYEMALATSSCLYSVKVSCWESSSEDDDDFNQEAVMELAAGLAPNLKEVVIVNRFPDWRQRLHNRPRKSWRGLPGFVTGQSTGSLTSLSLLGNVKLNLLRVLQGWANHTDLSHLRHLSLGGGYARDGMGMNDGAIDWIVENYSFPQLKTLRVRLDRHDPIGSPNYVINAVALLSSFEPLEQLSVSGPLEPKILDAILDRHGQTLTKLSLRPVEHQYARIPPGVRRVMPMAFTKERILQIHTQCPILEELAVLIKRTKSNALEAEIYKSFGRIERLRSLFLILDCSNGSVSRDPDLEGNASFDVVNGEAWSRHVNKGHVRETLMNCAVDDTLARSIWETICQNKAGQKLENLKLWTDGGGHFGDGTFGHISDIINDLSRSWLIERVSRDDGDIINVRELGQRAREAHGQEVTDKYKRRSVRKGIEPEAEAEESDQVQLFRRIWPRKEGSKDWRKDWSSFPLQV